MTSMKAIGERLQAVLGDRGSKGDVGGAVVGISVGDEQLVLAHGSANLNTGQPFTEDTGFLLGSVTKVLVTTALLRFVERGQLDLDAPVKRYLPDFALSDKEAAERITVRMLVNHTNGIDSDALCPATVRGRDATAHYISYLADVGVLFEPGTSLTYSNPGFVVASRIMEMLTGLPFERFIQTELFDPAGMRDATALQTQALLRRTAVGAFMNPETQRLEASHVFTLGEGLAGGGTTLIVSPQDMLAFGRMHLRGGVAVNGTRVLGEGLVTAMRTTSFDLGIPQAPPMGLGWWACPIAGTTAYHHSGGSPGGTSSFCIIPEYDAVIISFATGPGTGVLQDELHNAAIEALTGRPVLPPIEADPQPIPADLAGEYRAFQHCAKVEVKGDELLLTMRYEPCDEEHREFFKDMFNASRFPPVTFRCLAPGQFVPVGAEPKDYSGFLGRAGRMLAALPATPTRRAGLHTLLRFTPKVSG